MSDTEPPLQAAASWPPPTGLDQLGQQQRPSPHYINAAVSERRIQIICVVYALSIILSSVKVVAPDLLVQFVFTTAAGIGKFAFVLLMIFY